MTDHTMHRYSSVIAGGSGTRLWPFSRRARPKQLLPVAGGMSLLEHAWHRVDGVVPAERRIVCAAEGFRGVIRGALPGLTDDNYLGEPVGRDTINAVGLIAFVLASRDPHAVFCVLTADHLIEPPDAFRARLTEGYRVVEGDPSRFVTFGIRPTHAATGYGYVERGDAIPGFDGAFRAKRFVEKPDRARAEEYLAAGTFAWNSGMFVFHAQTMCDAIRRFKPECAAGLAEIARAYDTPARAEAMARVYPTLPKTSIDYGVMEPAGRDAALTVCTLPMELSWLDVGSWPSYAETVAPDDAGNRVNAHWCDSGSRNVLVVSDDPTHLVATVGCEDLVIVHTKDATLVCPRAAAEKVKEIAEKAPEAWR
jgi:mannose-1-phosphate guanylyltransferase